MYTTSILLKLGSTVHEEESVRPRERTKLEHRIKTSHTSGNLSPPIAIKQRSTIKPSPYIDTYTNTLHELSCTVL